MSNAKTILIGIAGVVVIGVLFTANFMFGSYQKLASSKQDVDTAWSNVTIQMQARAEIVPQVVGAVQGYTDHEHDTIEAVAKAREKLASAQAPVEKDEANALLTTSLNRLIMIQENYPQLKADKGFHTLIKTCETATSRVKYAKEGYNEKVQNYNKLIVVPPTSFVAGLFNFTAIPRLEAEGAAAETPKVDFTKKSGGNK